MEGWKVELFSARELRAMLLVPVAVLALVVSALVWIHPGGGAKHVSAAAMPRPTPQPVSVQAWYFATSKLGWVVLSDGGFRNTPLGLYRTSDGGRSWKKLPLDLRQGYVSRLTFFDSKHGYVFIGGYQAAPVVLSTSDGGDHWQPLPTPLVPDGTGFLFISPGVGWSISPGSRLQRTTDGGRTWTALDTTGLPRTGATQFQFASSEHGWVPVLEQGRLDVYVTDDGGESWAPPTPGAGLPFTPRPGAAQVLLSTVGAPPAYVVLLAFAVGNSSQTTTLTGPEIFDSPNAGLTWSGPLEAPGPGTGASVDLLDGSHWWLVQSGGELYRSSDAGGSWTAVGPMLPPGLLLATVHFFDQRNAIAVAWPSSRTPRSLVATSDGGVHWTPVSLPRS